MLQVLLLGLILAATVAGCGDGQTPEQRLRNAGFTSEGAPNFLTIFGDPTVDHGVFLRRGSLTLSLVEFESAPSGPATGSTEALVGKTLLILIDSEPSDDLRRRFAEAVRIARG